MKVAEQANITEIFKLRSSAFFSCSRSGFVVHPAFAHAQESLLPFEATVLMRVCYECILANFDYLVS